MSHYRWIGKDNFTVRGMIVEAKDALEALSLFRDHMPENERADAHLDCIQEISPSSICLFWGALSDWQRGAGHLDCGVILTKKNLRSCTYSSETDEITMQIADGKVEAAVCECECTTCKRAWFADGRPLVGKDGKIVRSTT